MSMPAHPGNCPIIATPFTGDGAVDYPSLRNQIRTVAERGCEAATMFGIASEFYKLANGERRQIAEVVTETAAEAGIASVLSVTHEATTVAVDHAEEYETLGADCVMLFPPRQQGTAEEIEAHVRRVGEAVECPVMVQHTPGNVAVEPETFAEINREVPNVRYFKIELDPPGPYISRLDDATGDDASILVGNWGYRMMDAYDRGAVGVMPLAVYPALYVEIDRRRREGDREGATELHDHLLSFLNDVRGVPHAKRIMAEEGIIETPHCRVPTGEEGDDVTERRLWEAHERLRDVIDGL